MSTGKLRSRFHVGPTAIASALALIALGTSLGAGTPSAAASSKHVYKFAVIGALVHPFYGPMPGALAAAAKAYGISPVPVFTTPETVDQVAQNAIVNGYVAQGYTGIAMQVDDPVAGNVTIARVVARGIPVVAIGGCPNLPSKASFCLATANSVLGFNAGVDMAKALGGKGNVALLLGEVADVNTEIYENAVKQALKSYPGIHLTHIVTGLDVAQDAQTGVASLLACCASQIDGIISLSGDSTPVLATKFTQLKETRIKAIGLNTFPATTLQAVKQGYLYGTMAQNPYGQAYLAAFSLKLLVDGCKWTGPSFVNAGTFLVTQSTVATAASQLAAITTTMASTWKQKYFSCPAGVGPLG